MKALKPSLREKKRYMLITGKDASIKNIEEAILKFIGILGYSKASPKIIKEKNERIVLSVNRKELDKIRASFLMSGKDIKVLRISGILRKL